MVTGNLSIRVSRCTEKSPEIRLFTVELQGFHVAVLCRLITLAALVYSAVQSSVLLVDTFDLVSRSPGSNVEPPKTFDIIYFVMLVLLLLSTFLAIFGIIFYRAYLTVGIARHSVFTALTARFFS